MRSPVVGRREFLRMCGLVGASALAAACAPEVATPAPEEVAEPTSAPEKAAEPTVAEAKPTVAEAEPTAAPASKYQESPMLAAKVEAGELPPVDERLPLEPKLVNEMPSSVLTLESGRFGGDLRTVTAVPEWDADVFVMNNEPIINTPGILAEEITPNIVRDLEVSDDQKEFTFYLREGLKWSDGEPVTTEDVRFTIEDVLFNEELTATFPQKYRAGNSLDGDPMDYEIIDDFTFKLKFSEPYGGFLPLLAIKGWIGYTDLIKPAHYLKQFHIKYTDEETLKPLMEEEAVEDWIQLFSLKDVTNWELCNAHAIGFPRLYPWLLTEVTDQYSIYERNPYYFKVDQEGKQLPYIDRVVSYRVADMETVAMQHITGQVDFARESATMAKMPLYRENEEKGGFKALLARTHVTYTDVFLNWTYDDPVWREVVQNLKFREALAHAIDGDEIIDAVFYGAAEPSTLMRPYDPDKANALLDEIGMDKRDAEGFRLGPDGNTFVIHFETAPISPDQVPTAELVTEFWNTVGVKTQFKQIEDSLRGQRLNANEIQASTVWTHTPLWYMADFMPTWWAPLWWRWWTTDGAEGEEPPEDVQELYRMMESLSAVPPEEGRQIHQQWLDALRDNLYFFVHCERQMQPLIVNAKLGNIVDDPEAFAIAWNFSGEQFYFKE